MLNLGRSKLDGAEHHRARSTRWRLGALGIALLVLLVVAVLGVGSGSVSIPPRAILAIIWSRVTHVSLPSAWPDSWSTILYQIRIPRVILGALVGATLAVAGAVYQAIFRNPLADPYLIGISSGASFGATLAIYFTWRFQWGGLGAISLAAFIGALLTTAAIYNLARVGRRTPVTTLILAGVALSAILSSATTLMLFTARDAFQTVHALGWLMGSLALSNWDELWAILPYLAVGFAVIGWHIHTLNVLQLDEDQAYALGVDVERAKLLLIVATSLATAAAVSVSGVIGFVGLVAPHVVRILFGPDHRFLLPMSALLGACGLIAADALARVLFAPRELPLGVVTALVGAPFFIYLLRRQKREVF